MPKIRVVAIHWKCRRCDHDWPSRLPRKPIICPKCKRLDWDGAK